MTRLEALRAARNGVYANASELSEEELWERYGEPLMRYAPKGHKTWFKRQVRWMIRAAKLSPADA